VVLGHRQKRAAVLLPQVDTGSQLAQTYRDADGIQFPDPTIRF
jgi:hypothetical protein